MAKKPEIVLRKESVPQADVMPKSVRIEKADNGLVVYKNGGHNGYECKKSIARSTGEAVKIAKEHLGE